MVLLMLMFVMDLMVLDWVDKDSFFRETFHPKFIKETEYYNYFVKQDIKIDLLHIDTTFCEKGF